MNKRSVFTVYNVVEVIDGNYINFATVGGSSGNQLLIIGQLFHSKFHHHVSGKRLALHENMQLSLEWRDAEI